MQKWLNVGQSEKESDICTFTVVTKRDEGRSINTLQNGVILSILNTWKSENTRFVGNEEWQYYDVYLQQSVSAIFCSSFFFHKSLSVNSIVSYKKKLTCLDIKRLFFIFETIIRILLNIYPWSQCMRELTAVITASSKQQIRCLGLGSQTRKCSWCKRPQILRMIVSTPPVHKICCR